MGAVAGVTDCAVYDARQIQEAFMFTKLGGAWWLALARPLALCCAGLPLAAQAQSARVTPPKPATEARNLLVQAAPTASQNQTQRVALVIGNAAYRDAPLTNPVNDARAIALALKESGFTVIARENVDQRGMLSALREFGDRLRAGGTGLFYYAGHGMQIKGRNYLIPVGASVEREDEVAYSAVDAQAVLDKMEAAGNMANIMILDACRNNPFTRSSRSGQTGLAQMDAPVGTLVAYATSPGAVASDGSGANGLYTQHLLTAIRLPGYKVEDVFKQVRVNVRRDSQGKQVPWEATSLEGDFYFRGGPAAVVAPPMVIPVAAPVAPIAAAMPTAPQKQSAPVVSLADSAALQGAGPTHDQAEVDRRTAELLAGLQGSSSLAALVPAPVALPVRPARARNSAGFTVGDKWRFQQVDQFKQEVVKNWERRVTAIAADGSINMNDGRIQAAPDGTVRSTSSGAEVSTEYSTGYKRLPSKLVEGFSEDIHYSKTWRDAGQSGVEETQATLKVLGREKVKVPAGEFDAWKIQIRGTIDSKSLSKNTQTHGTFTEVYWYVPGLRHFVASEYDRRWGDKIDRHERNELTSFSVRGADHLAQR